MMSSRTVWASLFVFLVLAGLGWTADAPAPDAAPKTDVASPAGASTTPADTSTPAAAPLDSPAKAPVKPVDAEANAAAKAEFTKTFTEWKSLIGDLKAMQLKYRTANEEKRMEIEQQWGKMMAKGDRMADGLLDSAEKAYAAAPNEDIALTEFLVKMLGAKLKKDDFESAARIGTLLMENQCEEKQLPFMVGVATLAVADYDSAERYLKKAVEAKLQVKTGSDYLDNLVKAFLMEPMPDEAEKEDAAKTPKVSLRDVMKQAWAKEKQIRENEASADNLPRVLLKTSKGDIELELFENDAPIAVGNFIYLVEKKFYNGLPFHRVLPGFMAQGGDPNGNGTGGPGYKIPCECYKANFRHHFRGSLSMAHAGRDTGGSQFFLTFSPTVSLDGRHTVFGRVISGMDVLAKLQRIDPDDKEKEEAVVPDKIVEAKVLRKRAHEYVPKKLE